MKKSMSLIGMLVVTAVSLILAGCFEDHPDHPTGDHPEHPSAEKAASEHPAVEKAVSEHPAVEKTVSERPDHPE
jgi:hypothetical protein